MGRRAGSAAAAACISCAVLGLSADPASATSSDTISSKHRDAERRWLAFSGASVAEDSYYFYSGARAALSGDLNASGFVAGIASGSGLYRYRSAPAPGGTIGGRFLLVEATGGYQWTAPTFGVTAMAGVRHEDHELSFPDPGNRVQGDETGAVGRLELWLKPAPSWLVTAGAEATSVFGGYHLRAGLARKLPFGRDLHAGVEAALMGNDEYRQTRAGLTLTGIDIGFATIALSGGVADDSETGSGAYGALSAWGGF